jgi:acyl carrier protein
LIVLGSEPDPELVAKFRQSFDFDPYLLSAGAEGWSMHPLRRRVEFKGAADLWHLLCTTAAGVFDVEVESLTFGSSPENTPGWNSLGFMRLVAAVEQTFATRIPPRDMMAVRQLGDIAGILSKQANG